MAASSPILFTKSTQAALIEYYKQIQNLQNTTRSESRARYEMIDRKYQRELDQTEENRRAKAANENLGDPTRYQNITVPVVMPQVEAAVTYQSSVFLTGSPLFGVVAAPKFMDAAMQMESILEESSIRGGWARQLLLFFRDGFKYNFAPLEVSWQQEVTHTVETDVTVSTKEGTPKEVIWAGNSIRRLDPYNTFVDTRVAPSQVYKDGEFAGYTEFMSRIKLKSFIASLPDKIIANIVPAFESGLGTVLGAKDSTSRSFYLPSINKAVSEDDFKNGTNWDAWAGLASTRDPKIQYKDGYEVTTLYIKILPSDFNIAVTKSNTPQIFKLIIINHEWIIYAEHQTNAHGYLPIMVGQPLEDGLDYQTKALAENGAPFQDLATSYMTSIIASRRRAISDRTLYDPSRISSAHINSANPSAKIPVRPAAYGKNISEAVYQFPYREDQAASSMQQIQSLLGLANSLNGQNQATQGQFVKGNRTLQEFEDVMRNANGRDQLASILLEHQVLVPIKHILKLNVLQFQGGTTIFNRDRDTLVEVDPVVLRKSVFDFRISDGLVPSSKLINADSFATALQVIGSSPQIAGGYNIGQLFSYLMKTQGAKINEFEKSPEQVAYEQALASWQQVAMEAVNKGADLKQLPPQPTPQQYGFNPNEVQPQPTSEETTNGSTTT